MSRVDAATAAEILDVLTRYAQVIDNRDWSEAATVFTPNISFGGESGIPALAQRIDQVSPYHPHHTTNIILDAQPDGSIRAWSKYFIVRTDGSAASGDYLDTLVRTPQGWRIARREVSRGNRPQTDPGGPATRSFSFQRWLEQ